MSDRDRLIELIDGFVFGTQIAVNSIEWDYEKVKELADYLLANGVILSDKIIEAKKKVYFPFPIDCKECSKVVADIEVCEELDLLYAGKHPKYTKEQDWDFMCKNCPHEVTEREYEESDEKHIGKTVFLTKEEAEAKLKELKIMRELLFRGKRVDNSEWIEGYVFQVFDDGFFITDGKCHSVKVIPGTIGQYTGLTNKNGTKIFEGDIVEFCDIKGVINFDTGCYCVKTNKPDWRGRNNPAIDIVLNEYENELKVIGNIHDNHELLKEREGK